MQWNEWIYVENSFAKNIFRRGLEGLILVKLALHFYVGL